MAADDELARAVEVMAAAERVTVLTGAGVSTDSGIPDYRGPDGLWTKNPKAELLSTIGAYLGDPEVRRMAWEMRKVTAPWTREPNPAHLALVDLERQGRLRLLVTQNVDSLHAKAGTSLEKLVEIHGSVRTTTCVGCGERRPIQEAIARLDAGEDDPSCRSCGGILKTSVVYFGEGLDHLDVAKAVEAAKDCDVFLAAGTSLQVHPAAGLPEVAVQHGARLVIANAERTPLDSMATAVVRGRLAEVLPAMVGPSS